MSVIFASFSLLVKEGDAINNTFHDGNLGLVGHLWTLCDLTNEGPTTRCTDPDSGGQVHLRQLLIGENGMGLAA